MYDNSCRKRIREVSANSEGIKYAREGLQDSRSTLLAIGAKRIFDCLSAYHFGSEIMSNNQQVTVDSSASLSSIGRRMIGRESARVRRHRRVLCSLRTKRIPWNWDMAATRFL